MTVFLAALAVSTLSVLPDDAPLRAAETDGVTLQAPPPPRPASASDLASKRARRAEFAAKLDRNFGPAPALLIIFSIPNMISGVAIGVFGALYAGFGWTLPGALILLAGILRFGAGLTAVIGGPVMAHAREREAQVMREEMARIDAELRGAATEAPVALPP